MASAMLIGYIKQIRNIICIVLIHAWSNVRIQFCLGWDGPGFLRRSRVSHFDQMQRNTDEITRVIMVRPTKWIETWFQLGTKQKMIDLFNSCVDYSSKEHYNNKLAEVFKNFPKISVTGDQTLYWDYCQL